MIRRAKQWPGWIGLAGILLAAGIRAGETVAAYPLTAPDALKGWHVNGGDPTSTPTGVRLSIEPGATTRGVAGIFRGLPTGDWAGRRLTLRVEVKAENLAPGPAARPYDGGKFMLTYKKDGRDFHREAPVPRGAYDWRPLRFSLWLPRGALSARLALGMQNAHGALSFRNLAVEADDYAVDFRPLANMGYTDEAAGDARGGWSDQGPDNDAAGFDFKKDVFGGVPFAPLAPADNTGKTLVTFRSAHFPSGSVEVETAGAIPADVGRQLYLLHTLCHGGEGVVGYIDAVAADGRRQTIEVRDRRDVADWWRIRPLENGWPGAVWRTRGGNEVGVYVSRFALDFTPDKLVFRATGQQQVWLLLAATLSREIHAPVKAPEFTIRENDLPPWNESMFIERMDL